MFSILSINTWKCDGDYNNRLPVLADGLASLNSDIVVAQEVYHNIDNQISTVSYLEQKINKKSNFFPSRRKVRNQHDSYSGLCIYTNFEIVDYKEIFLPTHPDDGDRTAQILTVNIDGVKVTVVNTHLTHLKNQSDLRIDQFDMIIENLQNIDTEIILICGDLNAIPTSEEMQIILGSEYGFIDVSENQPTHKNGRKLDYILLQSNIDCKINKSEIVLNQEINGILPSDHYGLLTEIKTNI